MSPYELFATLLTLRAYYGMLDKWISADRPGHYFPC